MTIDERIALWGLTPEEITPLAEHERVCPTSSRRLRAAIRDGIAAASAAGAEERVALRHLALRHFPHDHLGSRPSRLLCCEPETERT